MVHRPVMARETQDDRPGKRDLFDPISPILDAGSLLFLTLFRMHLAPEVFKAQHLKRTLGLLDTSPG